MAGEAGACDTALPPALVSGETAPKVLASRASLPSPCSGAGGDVNPAFPERSSCIGESFQLGSEEI